jgi:hypothetical protein
MDCYQYVPWGTKLAKQILEEKDDLKRRQHPQDSNQTSAEMASPVRAK